jgi:hypothetical protein
MTAEKPDEVLATFYGSDPFTECAISGDGKIVMALDRAQHVHFLRLVRV